MGLDPTTPNSANNALACFATDAATGVYIPRYQDQHPNVPGFFANSFSGEAFGGNARDKVLVEVDYQPPEMIPGAILIEIISNSGRRVISRWPSGDQKGQPIFVGYAPNGYGFPAQISPSQAAGWAKKPNGIFTDIVTADVLDPGTTLRFVRRETGSPLTKSLQYRRATNTSNWQNQPPGTWLCTKIDGRNITQGGNLVAPNLFDVTYEFVADPLDLWTQYPVYRNKNNGEIPQDIQFDTNYNGYTKLPPYGTQDFGGLTLPNAF
jgi:hypothetical protein